MFNKLTPETIRAVLDAGFQVFMYEPDASWLYFTDGTQIGYLENARGAGLKVSTVHMPNHRTGTGFAVEEGLSPDQLTRELLARAFMIAPPWANGMDLGTVKKWRDFEHFAANQRGMTYAPVTA